MDTRTALKLAKEIDYSDIRSDARSILDAEDGADFVVCFERAEYRFIRDDEISSIFREEMEELADDCYDISRIKERLGNVGQYFTFDYDAFVRDCEMDGYGHHFAGYDGEEIEADDWHAFRIN